MSRKRHHIGHWCRLSLKDTIKAIASILIPVMIGVFTLVLAWQEHVQGQANRRNDIEIANNERASQIHLEEYRRDQDRKLAASIQMDNVLSTFYREMSELILENNITLHDETMRRTFVLPKILSTLRQLDSTRKTLIIKYLYESNLLSVGHNPFDLSGVDLSNIDLSSVFHSRDETDKKVYSTMNMLFLSLPNVRLVNASLCNLFLNWANFERSDLTGAKFCRTFLRSVVFYQTNLSFTDFTDAVTAFVDFEQADLINSNINKKQLDDAFSSYRARLPNGQEQYERKNRLSYVIPKNCSLNNWYQSFDIDVVHLLSNAYQCTYQGRTSNATLVANIGTIGFEYLVDKESAWITIELDVYGNKSLQNSITLPVNINLRCLKRMVPFIVVIDEDVDLLQQQSLLDNIDNSTNLIRLKSSSVCPSETRIIQIEIKLTAGVICSNISVYIGHSITSELNVIDNEFEENIGAKKTL